MAAEGLNKTQRIDEPEARQAQDLAVSKNRSLRLKKNSLSLRTVNAIGMLYSWLIGIAVAVVVIGVIGFFIKLYIG